ncbi:MAG: DUF167 domain-containing protein [Deltaproteobacteria bacterium]|nr:DUF167 domain-containing protein [Deltaproteobacteria bacterium]
MAEGPLIPIRQTAAGVVFSVRVIPRASHPGIAGVQGEALKVRIAAPPVEGKANEACIGLLADLLGIKKGQVAIIAGHASRTKTVAVAGIGAKDVAALLPREDDRDQ